MEWTNNQENTSIFDDEENWDDENYQPSAAPVKEYDLASTDDEDFDDYDDDTCDEYDDFACTSTQGHSSRESSKKQKPGPSNTNKNRQQKDGNEGHRNRKRNSKVEMKTVSLPNDIKDLVMDTLRSIHGENFSLDNEVVVSKRELSDRYWVNRGQLTVTNCYNYSNKNKIDREKVNSIVMENLEKCGFYTNHCYEALVHTNNDFAKSVEFLLKAYFNVQFTSCDRTSTSKNITEMDDELVALKSIYENLIEERTKHVYWAVHLELPYLAKWYFGSSLDDVGSSSGAKISRSGKPLCRLFANTGTCRFGARCRFSHENPNEKKNTQDDEKMLKSSFELQIRFPDDCPYPDAVPVILFLPKHKEFSSHICLRITKLLLKEASICSRNGFPYCYNLIDLLQNNSVKVIQWLEINDESKLTIDSRQSLLQSKEDKIEVDEPVECIEKRTHKILKEPKPAIPTENRDEDVIRMMQSKYNSHEFNRMQRERSRLPAWNSACQIIDTLTQHRVVVIVGETGCGKSTQIPQFILDEWLYAAAGISRTKSNLPRVEIICTQPRRLSAIGVASRVAQERLEKPGDVVGYQIRLENCMSSLTKLLFCTTGILLKKLETDPFLKSTTHVIVDEVHERGEESDFLLLILKELLTVRPDLKVLLMSATLNAALFSSYFDGAPVIEIPGKMYPVTELYLEDVLEICDYTIDEFSKNCRKTNKTMSRDLDSLESTFETANMLSAGSESRITAADEHLSARQLFHRYKDYNFKTRKSLLLTDVEKLDTELIVSVLTWIVEGEHDYPRDGSILVFLPGLADITSVHDELKGHPVFAPRNNRFVIIPLHSTISNEEQAQVFRRMPRGVRKVVLSTNIAETSITIDDCVFVIDSGKMKENRFDTNKNLTSLETVWISKANAHQRRGRAGRVMPGLCVRLYTRHRYEYVLTPQPIPEIRRVPLDQIILRTRSLQAFRSKTIEDVLEKVLEPPSQNSIETAVERLQDIGALDEDKELTALGRHLSVLPVDVKIGKLILFGAVFCCLDSVLTIAASLSNKSPFVSPFAKREVAEAKKRSFAISNSDHLTVLNAYKKWHQLSSSRWQAGKRFAEENFLSWRTLEMMGGLKHQYLELLVSIGFASLNRNIRRRQTEDKVLFMTSKELNKNGDNHKLLLGILCAALYPNLVEVQTPDKEYIAGVSGAIPKEHSAQDLRFRTKADGYVFLHPSSVNSGVKKFFSPYLVYQEKMKTSKVFIHDSTMVSSISLILFAGADLQIELNSGSYIASLENGWLSFTFRSLEDAKMIQCIRREFSKLLEEKIENPHMNLTDNNRGRMIIATMTDIITKTIG